MRISGGGCSGFDVCESADARTLAPGDPGVSPKDKSYVLCAIHTDHITDPFPSPFQNLTHRPQPFTPHQGACWSSC